MTAEEEGTIQVNVRLYREQVERIDKRVKESIFKNRSDYLRTLIDKDIKLQEAHEEIQENLKKSKRELDNMLELKPALIMLFEESDIKPELKKEAIKFLKRDEKD